MTSIDAFITGIPKAELHLHIEGTLEPQMVFDLAAKHGVALRYPTVEALRSAYQFDNLQSFLDVYYMGADVLRDEADFYALTWAYLQRAHQQGIVHVEIFFDPQSHTSRGVEFAVVIGGIQRALAEGERVFGITHRLIMCFLRHLSAADAMRTLEESLPFAGEIAAVGLDSSELGHPPEKFAQVFERARREGFLTVAHAGEEGPPSFVSDALDLLQVERIDHGVRSEEDPALLARLVREQIPLTVCPLSNVMLRVVDRIENHNLKRLMDHGVCVTVNSDDPAYFGGYLAENLRAVYDGLQLSRADITQLARNSLNASFLPEAAKTDWMRRIDEFVATAAGLSR
jgi:adenine deaminase